MNHCPVVKTTKGLVKGIISKSNIETSKEVFNFLSIPYGKPPICERRFRPPESVEKWKDIFDASQTLINCPQDIQATSRHDKVFPYKNSLKHTISESTEDCLRLSIFTPTCEKGANLPVMVWLTGGSYQRNVCGRVDGTALAGINNVVVVVMNFRVNVLGFMHLGPSCPGNNGLLDVQLGLRWVKEEISGFGGNPGNVCLFGESSGSGMVHLLMFSPLSAGLFHKAILQSGACLSPFFIDEEPEKTRKDFLKSLDGLSENNEDDLLKSLQDLPLEEFRKTFSSSIGHGVSFMPIVDGHVIPKHPSVLLQSRSYMKIPIIIGCTDSEAGYLLSQPMFADFSIGPNEESVKRVFTQLFTSKYPEMKIEETYAIIKKFYLDENNETPFKYIKMFTDFLSDIVFVIPIVSASCAHSANNQPTYLYQMKQKPDLNHSLLNGPTITKKPDFVSCDHCDDLYFVWGTPFIKGELNHEGAYFTDEEIELSLQVMKYFTNFAAFGDPNIGQPVDVNWPKYDALTGDQLHLELKSSLTVGKNLAMDKMALFKKLFF